MDLLQDIIDRSGQNAPLGWMPGDDVKTPQGVIPGSLLESWLKKKKPADEFLPPIAPTPLDKFSQQAGLLAPGVGGLGNMNATTTRAPVNPLDPEYAAPASTASQLMDLVRPSTGGADPVPMPQARPREVDGSVADDTPDSTVPPEGAPTSGMLPTAPGQPPAPPNARPAQPSAPPLQPPVQAAQQAAAPEQSMFGRLGGIGSSILSGLGDNSATLLALGAGFAGAPNIGQGISRGAAAAVPASQADLKNRTSLQAQSSLYRALVTAGVPAQQAIAAVGNPALAQKLMDNYLVDRKAEIKEIKTKDAFGNETTKLVAVDPYTMAAKDINTNGGGASVAGGATGGSMYAPGVSGDTFDHTKVGEEYLAQFSPEMQSSVKNFLLGRSSPTGRQVSAQAIRMAATKYGDDVGMPADDASIVQRKEWARSLGDTKSGVGLQTRGLQQGLEHFAKLSDALVNMHLSNGLGFEPAAGWANYIKSLSTEQQEKIKKANFEGTALAGEMGNLFSKNGGGVHEREAVKKAVSDAFQSGKSAAGSLEGVDEMMQGGLSALTQRRDQLFPNGGAPKGSEFMGKEQEAALAKIRKNIAILKGEEQPEAPAIATAPRAKVVAPPPGKYVFDPITRTMKPAQ